MVESIGPYRCRNIINIRIKSIMIPNKSHFDTCVLDNIYSWYEGIVGICGLNNNKYILKDGYHRLASTRNRDKVLIIIANFN